MPRRDNTWLAEEVLRNLGPAMAQALDKALAAQEDSDPDADPDPAAEAIAMQWAARRHQRDRLRQQAAAKSARPLTPRGPAK